MDLYLKITLELSRKLTKEYTSSFYAGMRLLNRGQRKAIYGIYGFVRVADEIVDTFHDADQRSMLAKFKADTYEAVEEGISANPILHSFQWVVNQYGITHELVEAFFASMEMDLEKQNHDQNTYETYIYGSAEVVGLMCLKVFYPDDGPTYEDLVYPARKLGQAFQKINFLRDIGADLHMRDRVYFPGLKMESFQAETKKQIEAEIRADFKEALPGIRQLHRNVRLGVYLAYLYYYQLLIKIGKWSPEELRSERASVSRWRKLLLLGRALVRGYSGRI
jgi:15-cis-phytoene synthase